MAALLILLTAGTASAGALWVSGAFGKEPFNGPTARVARKKLQIAIVERGELQAAKNADVVCTVRARSQGSTIATTIKWLIDNGTEVSKGDKLVELDDSGLQEQLKTEKITVDQAKADWIKADEQYNIDDIQTMTDYKKAENDRDLAKIDLKKYVEGDYVQNKKDLLGQIETARSDYEQWQDRSAWSQRMLKKGLGSRSQAESDKSRLDASRIALEKAREALRVLEDKTWGLKQRTVQDLSTKVDQAERTLKKCQLQRRATLAQDQVLRLSKKSVYEQELAKQREIEGEIAKCVLLAPQDGLVVYYIPEQTRFGAGTQQSLPAQGEPVREGQKIMQIPDLTQMLVNVRVHEAMVSHLHNEDPDDRSSWQHARIRVDAFPSKVFRGHVKTVDNTASTLDFFASDVKVYKTMVAVDSSTTGLKPGMSGEVTIIADESPAPVLVIPVQSVLGTISMGAERKCFVVGPEGQPELRDIVVGMSNEREVEVKSGVREGEVVVLNPRPLLPEDSELKAGKVRTRQEEGGGQGGGGEGKAWKKKNGGAKGPGGAFPGAGKGAPGGEKAGPAAAAPEGKGGPAGASPEQMKAQWERFQRASPTERRDMLNQIPAEYRDRVRQAIRAKGLQVAD